MDEQKLRFPTFREVMETDEFENFIWKHIETEIARRESILKQANETNRFKGGARMKSDALYTLDKLGLLFPGKLADEYLLIVHKK